MKKSFKNQIRAALFAAIIAVLSLIAIPTPTGIPVTLQTFAVALSGFTLGRKYGLESVIIWLTVGALGLPVFSGMTGGMGKILGATGGFLLGFIPLAIFCGMGKKPLNKLIFSVLGLFLCHTIGTIWFSAVTQTNIFHSSATSSLPYIPKDIISVIIAYAISNVIQKRLTEHSN